MNEKNDGIVVEK